MFDMVFDTGIECLKNRCLDISDTGVWYTSDRGVWS